MPDTQLVTYQPAELQTIAENIGKSGWFGIQSPAQAFTLMMLCQAEGLHPVLALRRYHIVEGRPSMRADAMQGEYESRGNLIIWHIRDEEECSATFIRNGAKLTKAERGEAVKRAKARYKIQSKETQSKVDRDSLVDLSEPDEITIIRTMEEAKDSKLAMSWKAKDRNNPHAGGEWILKHNWKQSPRQMLHARCLTEGVRATDPGLIAGLPSEYEAQDIAEREREEKTPDQIPFTTQERVEQAAANAKGETNATIREVVAEHPLGTIYSERRVEIIADEPKATAPESSSTNPEPFDHNAVICHYGKVGTTFRGKRVDELHQEMLEWLRDRWANSEHFTGTPEDKKLLAAVNLRLAEIVKPEAPKEEKKPEPKKEPATVDVQSELIPTSKAEEPFDWREQIVPVGSIKGTKLGDLKDNIIRGVQRQIVPTLDASHEDFIAAVGLAVFERGIDVRDAHGVYLPDDQLIAALLVRIDALALTADQGIKYLVESGALTTGETLGTIDRERLLHLYQHWSEAKTAIQLILNPPAKPKEKKTKTKK